MPPFKHPNFGEKFGGTWSFLFNSKFNDELLLKSNFFLNFLSRLFDKFLRYSIDCKKSSSLSSSALLFFPKTTDIRGVVFGSLF